MATIYNIFNPPKWLDWNLGTLLALGTLTFYEANDHSIKKNVYKDNTGSTAWSNPLTLDQYGRSVFPIYGTYDPDSTNNGYYLEVRTSNGDIVYTIDDFLPPLTQYQSSAIIAAVKNLARNPQFSIWDHVPVNYTNGTTIDTSAINTNTYEGICDDWYFLKTVSDGTDNISRQNFTADQSVVPYNPEFYLRYTSTVPGTSTKRYIAQRYKSAIFMAGQTVSVAFWARSDIPRSIDIRWSQVFGTGGPASGTTDVVLASFNLSTTWQRYTTSSIGVTIPAVSGDTIGTDRNDYSYLIFSLNTGVNCTYDICNVQWNASSTINDFQQDTIENERAKLDIPYRIPTGKIDFLPINWYQAPVQTLPPDYEGYYQLNDLSIAKPGVAGTGYRYLNGFNLFCRLWYNFDDTACPVSTGRGANAVADWNAGKTLTFFTMQGRMPIGIGNGAGVPPLTPRNPGYSGGEESHTMTLAELVTHHHQQVDSWTSTNTDVNAGLTPTATAPATPNTQDTGSSTPFNVMNPFVPLPIYIHI